MHLPDPSFPPLLTGHACKAPATPVDVALSGLRTGALGAGDLIWARTTAAADLALVLEPEVALEQAWQMGPLLSLAVVEAIAALSPPKLAILHRWPNGILLNGAQAGRIEVIAPRQHPSEVPPWLVVSARIDLAPAGERADWSNTALGDEIGDEAADRTAVLEAVAAHFLRRLHGWGEAGFRDAHDAWLMRAHGREQPARFPAPDGEKEGTVVGLDDAASLMLRSGSHVWHLPFRPHVRWVAP